MRFNVTFQTTFPVSDQNLPLGRELLDFLSGALHKMGIATTKLENYEEFAWLVKTGLNGKGPYILLGHVGDEEFQWLVQIHSSIGLFGRLFGKSDSELRKKIAESLHQILVSDNRFRNVRWHEGNFNDHDWSSDPS